MSTIIFGAAKPIVTTLNRCLSSWKLNNRDFQSQWLPSLRSSAHECRNSPQWHRNDGLYFESCAGNQLRGSDIYVWNEIDILFWPSAFLSGLEVPSQRSLAPHSSCKTKVGLT